ncbi:MAG TPA: cytochrome P450 [Blastocatellia bacterium]|nr:cytochrome P450 [Blastocatellia bacterium]
MTRAVTPPGPKGKPVIGNLFDFKSDPANFLLRCAREYGDVVHFKLGPQSLFLVNDPEIIKDVLVTNNRNFVKSRGLELAKEFLGEGLLTSEGDFHLRQRRLAQPAFHRQRVFAYGEAMVDYSTRACEHWTDGETRDMAQEMMGLTMAVVGKTLFDADVIEEAKEIGQALTEMVHFFDRITTPFPKLMAKLPLPSNYRFKRAKERLDATIYRIINERRASETDRGDLLSMLLLAQDEEGDGGRMTDLQLRDEAMTIFLAGHETTANALSWTWYLLSQNPEAEARMHEEIDALLEGRLPTAADVARLVYTTKVFSEAMRMYPPAWTVGRRALNEYAMGEYVAPAGSIILMSQYVTHHDPRFFPEPFKFDPERWTPEAQAARPKFSYFPFGGGPRLCIGEQFAWMEGVLILATLARQWRMRLAPDQVVEPEPLITLRPKFGMRMIVERRATSPFNAEQVATMARDFPATM